MDLKTIPTMENFPTFIEEDVYVDRRPLNQWEHDVKKADGYKGIVNKITGSIAAIVSKKYELIQHKNVYDAFTKAVGLITEETQIKVEFAKNGARMFIFLEYPKVSFEVKKGDIVNYGLTVTNSVDGSMRLMVIPYTKRLICSNGMTHQEMLGGVQKKHLKNAKVLVEELPAVIKEGLNNVTALHELYKQWAITEAKADELLDELKKEKPGVILPKKYADEIQTKIKMGDMLTKWDLFNVLTELNWHDEKRQMDSKVNFNREIMKIVEAY